MTRRKTNPSLLFGISAILFFLFALRIHHPLLLIASGAVLVVAYQRFRTNNILHRQQQSKLKRQEGSIEVESHEIRETVGDKKREPR